MENQEKKFNFINYYDYCLAASSALVDFGADYLNIGGCGFNIFGESLKLELALIKNDKNDISKRISNISLSLANHILIHFKPSDQIYEQLTEVWWKPQFTITLPKDEFINFQANQDIYGDIVRKYFNTCKKVEGYNYKIKNCILNMSKSLVSIALSNSLVPLQILISGIEELYIKDNKAFDLYFNLNKDLIKEYKVI